MEDSIQFEKDIVNPGSGVEIEDIKINQDMRIVDDTVVSTDLLNQIDYRRMDK